MTRSPLAAIGATVTAIGAALALAACGGASDPGLPPFPLKSPVIAPSTTATAAPAEPTGQPDVTLAVFAYTDPPRITGRQAPACVARANGMLPDPACTPGSVAATADPGDDPAKAADQAEVCNAGFESHHRPATVRRFRDAAMKAYRVPAGDLGRVEYDHLIPLSLGGSNDVTNLWPQVSDLPARGFRNSKDGVELRLWRAVCVDKKVALADVQRAFARDWTAAEKFLGLSPR
jgi:hypothetical protein